jgi:predicted lipoprotein with Yx(FWY)xxD motif
MKQLLSARLFALAVAIGAAALLVAAVQAGTSSPGAVIALRKTALGTILVDARGRTLYLFEKDRRGVSTCNTACVTYWPALTSHGTPRAGLGVHQSLLGTTRRRTAGSRSPTTGTRSTRSSATSAPARQAARA